MVMPRVTAANLKAAVMENVVRGETVMTDESMLYRNLEPKFRKQSVKHREGEYVRYEDDGSVTHVNTAESSFSLLKRGIIGTFHNVSKKHLPLYLAEFDHRWNHRKTKDGERTVAGLQMAEGKRLTLKPLKAPIKAA